MNRSQTIRWLSAVGTALSGVFIYMICLQFGGQQAAKTELIDHNIDTNDWQVSGSNSMNPYFRIVSVLTNGEGCKTFIDDGNGNLVPHVESDYDSTDLSNNPFDDPNGETSDSGNQIEHSGAARHDDQ